MNEKTLGLALEKIYDLCYVGNSDGKDPISVNGSLRTVAKYLSNSSISEETCMEKVTTLKSILDKSAFNCWSAEKLGDYVKGLGQWSDQHIKIINDFWQKRSSKIISYLQKSSQFNSSYGKLDWRVDVKSMSKSNAELNEGVGIFRLELGEASSSSKVNFDMGKDQIKDFLGQLEQIEQKIDEFR